MAEPDPKPPAAAWLKYAKIAGTIVLFVGWAITAVIAFKKGEPLPPPPDVIQSPGGVVKGDDGAVYAMGRVDDPEEQAASFARFPVIQFNQTPAGRAVMGDVGDVFLWRQVRKAAGKPDTWYPNVNQRDVGCCVGCGWKHSVDVCAAVQIVTGGRAEEFKPVSVEVIYGGSRVEVGKGQIRGDGSLGAWAREFVRTWGVVPMERVGSVDLSAFDPYRARQFGSQGVPGDIEAKAKEHPVKGTAVVGSWQDVYKAIAQGYPVAICSNQGFANPNGSPGTRDADGFCAARGTWPHCMCIIGTRGGNRPGAFILNSWGDTAHNGPAWPADAPKAGFWADASVIDRIVKQGDSYALADLSGFPARPLNWEVRLPNKKLPADRFGATFALAW